MIEDLLENQHVKLAIADMFGEEKYINDKLKTCGKGIHHEENAGGNRNCL